MSTEVMLQVKLECIKIVVANNKTENRSIELVLKEADDLFGWIVKPK